MEREEVDGDLFENGVKHVEMAAEIDSINSSQLIVVGGLASQQRVYLSQRLIVAILLPVAIACMQQCCFQLHIQNGLL